MAIKWIEELVFGVTRSKALAATLVLVDGLASEAAGSEDPAVTPLARSDERA